MASEEPLALNWLTEDPDRKLSHTVDWEALVQYAIDVKRERDGHPYDIWCRLSPDHNAGGLNLVRRLEFEDGARWVARVSLRKSTPRSIARLQSEVHTMELVRERSHIPVPEVYAYEANCENPVGVPFIMMEFIAGDTAMDSFGGYKVHKGQTPEMFKRQFHSAMADVQTQLAAIRFPKIGSITRREDGEFDVGPIPGIGGPFDSAADYFKAWAKQAKFQYSEKFIIERSPPALAEHVLSSINEFPSRLDDFADRFPFQRGPFPLIHTDFLNSNIIIDPQHEILGVIDWENAMAAPWELIELGDGLSIVPPAMDGPLYRDTEKTRNQLADCRNYINYTRQAELLHGFDSRLSTTFKDWRVQHLANSIWLYELGRIGFYCKVLDQFGLKAPTHSNNKGSMLSYIWNLLSGEKRGSVLSSLWNYLLGKNQTTLFTSIWNYFSWNKGY